MTKLYVNDEITLFDGTPENQPSKGTNYRDDGYLLWFLIKQSLCSEKDSKKSKTGRMDFPKFKNSNSFSRSDLGIRIVKNNLTKQVTGHRSKVSIV